MKTKEELAEKVGMQFDEVAELFSEETLNSMQMTHTVGGKFSIFLFFCKVEDECTHSNCGDQCSECAQCASCVTAAPTSAQTTPAS